MSYSNEIDVDSHSGSCRECDCGRMNVTVHWQKLKMFEFGKGGGLYLWFSCPVYFSLTSFHWVLWELTGSMWKAIFCYFICSLISKFSTVCWYPCWMVNFPSFLRFPNKVFRSVMMFYMASVWVCKNGYLVLCLPLRAYATE